ncbi:MAG TPA: hypothetical protein PKX64_04655, partial [Elusimicrobiota bacterium]|nr:hypothetical protein [Elusimicrobiota bacterium]
MLANLAFGALHARVYTYQDGQWRIEQNPDGSPKTASWATRLSLAVRGMGIHSPLLLTSLTPLLGPLVTILGAAATVVLHMVHNQLAAQFGWRALTVGANAPVSTGISLESELPGGGHLKTSIPPEKMKQVSHSSLYLVHWLVENRFNVIRAAMAGITSRATGQDKMAVFQQLAPENIKNVNVTFYATGSEQNPHKKFVYKLTVELKNGEKPLTVLIPLALKRGSPTTADNTAEDETFKEIQRMKFISDLDTERGLTLEQRRVPISGGFVRVTQSYDNAADRFNFDLIDPKTPPSLGSTAYYVHFQEFIEGGTIREARSRRAYTSENLKSAVKNVLSIWSDMGRQFPEDAYLWIMDVNPDNFMFRRNTNGETRPNAVFVDLGLKFRRSGDPAIAAADKAAAALQKNPLAGQRPSVFISDLIRHIGSGQNIGVIFEAVLEHFGTTDGLKFLNSVSGLESDDQAKLDQFIAATNRRLRAESMAGGLGVSPAATIPGLVPLLAWAYGLDKNNRADLNLIVNEKAPLVESIVTGAFFYASVGLMSALGSFFGVSIDHSFFAATGLFALVNVAFGFSHRSVYRFAPAEPGTHGLGRWELESAPASRQTRWNLALRGMAIHAPLLLAFMDPFGGLFLAPLGALASVVLHAVHNRAAARFGWTALTAGHAPTAGPAAPKYIDAEGKAVLARAGAKLRASVEKLRRGGRLTEDDHVTGMFICSNNESRSAISEILARKALFNFNSSLVPAAERDQFQSSINAILPRLEVTSPEGTVTTLTMRSGMKLDFPEGTQYKEVLPEAPDPEALKTIRFFSAGLGANGFGRTRHYRAEALKANVSAVPPEVYIPPATTKFDENTLRARKPDFLIAFVDTKALRPDGRPAATALAVLKAQAKKLGFEDKLVIVEMPDEEPDTLWPKLTRFIQTEVLTGLGFSATKPAAAAPAHGPTRGAVGWWAPVANRLLDRFPSLANSRNLSFALFGALESVLLLAVNFLLPFTGYAEGSDLLNDATLGVALFGAHYVSGILNFNPETKRFEPAPGTFGRALGATAIASTTFVPLMMLDLFMTGGVSHWMTAAAGAAGVAAHALLNVRDSIVRWMGDRTRSVKTLATAALLSLNLLSVPLALSQANVENPALPMATLERAQVARLNMSQLAPGEASMKRAEQWMAKDNPLLQASAQMQRIKLEGANTPDDLKILTWLLEVTHTWKLDTSKVSAVVLTSNLPAPGMFNDLKKKGESDAEAKRVVYLDRNNTALGLLATWAHEAGHITRDNRQVAEADTLGEDSRIAASLLPYINDAAKDWPGVRERFGLPADLAFYNSQAMGVLGGTNLSARDAFWLRYDVVPAVAAFLLREAPTPALLSPNHSAVK